METDSQKFCLRWNNHQTNMIQFFDELRKNQDFTDVTLMSDTQEIIRCHKIVLAAGSFYFERVFHHVEPDQSTLVLTNTDFALLESLIMFMYRGEIHVHQDDLKALLKAAERLEVKGLNNFKDKNQLENGRLDEIPSPFLERSPPPSTTPRPQLSTPLSHADLYNLHVSNQAVNTISSQGIWPIPAFPFSQHPYHSHYSALSRSYIHNSDTSPLTKKKMISSASMASTPILRTALVGQGVVGQAHSTSGSNLDNVDNGSGSNGSANENDRRYSTDFSANEDPSSPHTDMEDDERKHSPSSRRNSFASNSAPKEWKRYKQYTREDINAAIDVVKAGEMSALRASRRFNVPSRTLYDKVKKLGIKTQRHSGRHSNRNGNGIGHRIENDSARFPYGVGGNSDGSIYRNSYGMVDPTELIMNMKHSSPSPKAQPVAEDDNLENMVEDLSIKNRQDLGGIHPLLPKEEFNNENPPPNESYNS